MTMVSILTSLPTIAVISFLFVWFLYWLGGQINYRSSTKSHFDKEKKILYASGEEPPHETPHIILERLVIYIIYFFVFDILAFILVTSFEHTGGAIILYAGIILISILFLAPQSWRKEVYV
jgi:NADH:ubiquinone oxidoreductase subunit 3 (subunit A)